MNPPLATWEAAYRPLLGKVFEGLKLMPMRGDSPSVTASLEEPIIGFSGAVMLACEGAPDLYLTWEQLVSHHFGLTPLGSLEGNWARLALDSLSTSPEEPWGSIDGTTLASVSLHSLSMPDEDAAKVVAAVRHSPRGPSGEADLWVCVADRDHVDTADDLLVSVGSPPPTRGALEVVQVIQ